MADANKVDWEIGQLRKEIGDDWAQLASKNLPADKRVVFREHLQMTVRELQDLVARHQTNVQKLRLNRFRRMERLELELSEAKGELKK